MNRDLTAPAFTLDSAGRTIAVEFHVNPDLAHRPQATQMVEASLTGTEHVVRLPGAAVLGHSPTRSSDLKENETTMLTRLRDEERGVAMIMALVRRVRRAPALDRRGRSVDPLARVERIRPRATPVGQRRRGRHEPLVRVPPDHAAREHGGRPRVQRATGQAHHRGRPCSPGRRRPRSVPSARSTRPTARPR